MKELDNYFDAEQKVYDYFGVEETWTKYPIEDSREYYWYVSDYKVMFSEQKEDFSCPEGPQYSNVILGSKNDFNEVYRTKDYTMIAVDTQCDHNMFLSIFDNTKEIKEYTEE